MKILPLKNRETQFEMLKGKWVPSNYTKRKKHQHVVIYLLIIKLNCRINKQNFSLKLK